jgi:hypothetical protein
MNGSDIFDRLNDIPGVRWDGPLAHDPAAVDALRRSVQRIDGGWAYTVGGDVSWTSQSPASRRAGDMVGPGGSVRPLPGTVLAVLAEVVQLPGSPRDYYYAIATAVEVLNEAVVDDPRLYDDIHRLVMVQLDLVRARPDTVVQAEYGDTTPVRNPTADLWVDTCTCEGAFDEALAAATVMVALGSDDHRIHDLRQWATR